MIFKKGDKGEGVKKVQHWLNEHGYKAGAEDGVFGEKTRDAVIQFQSAVKTNTDGVADERTQIEMKKVDTGKDMKYM
jgi:peptidoglycan hydrolase-like protein with peptidoglycan-binding domain